MTTSRRIAALVGVLVALVLVPLAPVHAATPAEYATAAVKATNAQRVAHERSTLRVNKCLKRMARKAARRMADQQRMFHQALGPIQRQCGVNWVGENIAYGFVGGADVVAAWMKSPPHRANILNRRYRLLGIAARKGGDGYWYVSQVFGDRV